MAQQVTASPSGTLASEGLQNTVSLAEPSTASPSNITLSTTAGTPYTPTSRSSSLLQYMSIAPTTTHSHHTSPTLYPLLRHNTTATTATKTTQSASPLFTADVSIPSTGNGSSSETGDSLYNYFYIFLAVFLVALAAGCWFFRRQRRMKRNGRRNLRHSALARDLDGLSAAPRRWLPASWRSDHGATAAARREEGLDESGIAPPPYQSASSGHGVPSARPAIPLKTFTLSTGVGTKPPGYLPTVTEIHPTDES